MSGKTGELVIKLHNKVISNRMWAVSVFISLILTGNSTYILAYICLLLLVQLNFYIYRANKAFQVYNSTEHLLQFLSVGTGRMNMYAAFNNYYTADTPLTVLIKKLKRYEGYRYFGFVVCMCILTYCNKSTIILMVAIILLFVTVQLICEEKKYYFSKKWGEHLIHFQYTAINAQILGRCYRRNVGTFEYYREVCLGWLSKCHNYIIRNLDTKDEL